jgi:hypothetical protein
MINNLWEDCPDCGNQLGYGYDCLPCAQYRKDMTIEREIDETKNIDMDAFILKEGLECRQN